MKCYELKIVNKDDPLVQMNQLDTRINFLLNIALKKQKGIKFNLGFKIKFTKTVDGVETKDSSTISEQCVTVTHKNEIKEAVKLQKEGKLKQINKQLKKVCSDLAFDKIKTPVTIKDIPKIEKEFDISINLFGHNEDCEIYPILLTKKVAIENKHIDLLITSREDEHHYVWIKDF